MSGVGVVTGSEDVKRCHFVNRPTAADSLLNLPLSQRRGTRECKDKTGQVRQTPRGLVLVKNQDEVLHLQRKTRQERRVVSNKDFNKVSSRVCNVVSNGSEQSL